MKKIILIFLIIYSAYSKLPNTNEDSFCQQIQCGELTENTCIKVNSKISIFQECPSDKICNIHSDDPIEDAECIEKKTIPDFKKLPGLPCQSNDECLSNKCTSNLCEGKKENEDCQSPSDCEYGKTCRKISDNPSTYKCVDPVTTGNACNVDTDCVLESGCLNHKCTLYFSLDNNLQARDYDNEDFSFCKSGYSNDVGICKNITLPKDITECSDTLPCVYNIDDFENVTIPSNCLCGYNTEGKQYCLLGSGNRNYTKYIKKLKEYYINNKNCHLSERTATGCQKDLLSSDPNVLYQIQSLINAKYWAKANNKMIKAPDCVYKIELTDYNRSLDNDTDPPEPSDEGKCAKYSCNIQKNGEFCAKSKYESVFNINVLLNDICPEGVSCKIGGDPNEVFYNKTDINAKCSSYDSLEMEKRYPGEKCEVDTQCVYPLDNPSSQFHKCEDGRCNGMDEDGICADNSWCLAGYYCDQFSGKCKEQKSQGEKCLLSKDCQNNLLCLNGKCEDKLFGLKDGQKIPESEVEEDFQKKYCQSGQVMNGICVSYNDYDGKINDNEYRKCNFGEFCKYKINMGEGGSSIKYEKCPCGFNEEGQGYCPHYHEYFKSEWNEYRDELKKNYDNECHTENRYHCYEELNRIKQLKNKLERGHLFYKAVPCAELVLKGNYLHSKNIILALFGLVLAFL